jgi:hypothetical protein
LSRKAPQVVTIALSTKPATAHRICAARFPRRCGERSTDVPLGLHAAPSKDQIARNQGICHCDAQPRNLPPSGIRFFRKYQGWPLFKTWQVPLVCVHPCPSAAPTFPFLSLAPIFISWGDRALAVKAFVPQMTSLPAVRKTKSQEIGESVTTEVQARLSLPRRLASFRRNQISRKRESVARRRGVRFFNPAWKPPVAVHKPEHPHRSPS